MEHVTRERMHAPSLQDRVWYSAVEPTAIGLAVGISYFLAARLSLLLLTPTDGVAVFWPAAGVASGTLIALGPRAKWPVAVGVMSATITANLLGDRNIASAIVFALANAGEALFAASLIQRSFGENFGFESVRRVLSFVAATLIACACAAVLATSGVLLFHNQGATAFGIWLNWSLSDAMGAITVAPMIIGAVHAFRRRPEAVEILEGTLALAALSVVSAVTLSASSHHWFAISPLCFILPLLLWLAARTRPLFAALGVFVVAIVVVWTTTFGIGRFGGESIPDAGRVDAARTALLIVSLCGLVFASLFEERRQIEGALAESNERLRLAVDGAHLGIWSLDLTSGRFENDARDRAIHGHDMGAPPTTRARARDYIHPGDLDDLDSQFREAARSLENCSIAYRLASTAGSNSGRWVALEAAVRRDANGRALSLIGVTRDITEQRNLHNALQKEEQRFRELLNALPAAVYVTDAAGYVTYCNQAAVDLWGRRPVFGEDRWCDLAQFYDCNGVPMSVEHCPTEIALKQRRTTRNLEAILERPGGKRIDILPCPSPLHDATGAFIGVVNMTLDISERKRAEKALAERNMQLDLAAKVALVGSFAFDVLAGQMTISPGYATIHGLPEGTEQSSRADWRARVHPDDLPRLKLHLEQTIAARRHDHYCDYRIVRADGEVRWIEARSHVSYEGDRPRIVGTNIDVTRRKLAERALSERKMQLALAEKAAGVGSYAYDAGSVMMQITEGYAALHSLPEGTTDALRSEWKHRVHPDDLGWIEDLSRQSFRDRREEYGIEYRIIRPGGEVSWIESRSFISYSEDGKPQRVTGLNIDVTERRRAEDHQRLLVAELDHRVKNVLATVSAVSASTVRSCNSMQDFVTALDARIRSLASTHELLSNRGWQGLPLDELLRRQLAPYAAQNNVHIKGPRVLLDAEAGQALSMVLHELTTNAAKHGALSASAGHVFVQWRLQNTSTDGGRLMVNWREADGPMVKTSGKSGYGKSVITELIPYELGGKVDYRFASAGVRCRLEIPAGFVTDEQKSGLPLNCSPANLRAL